MFGWWYVDNAKGRLRLWEKLLVAVNLVLLVFNIWLLWRGFTNNLVENCWDKYATEQQAIEMCENG